MSLQARLSTLITAIGADIKAIKAKTDLLPTVVTVLPASADGKECYFQADAANSVVWHLRCRAMPGPPGVFRWEFLGGPPIQVGPLSQNPGGDTFANGAGYVAASATGGTGPNITIPAAGVFDIELTSYMRHGAAGGTVFYSFQLPNGTAAVDADSLYITMSAANVPDIRHSKIVRKTLTAGTLSARYKATGGSSVGLFDERAMRVKPVYLNG